MVTKQKEQEFDAYRDSYESDIDSALAFSGQEHDYFTKVKARYFNNILDKHFPNDTPLDVLDVGCGHGLIHPHLLNKDNLNKDNVRIKLTGIDVAASVIEVAQAQNTGVQYDTYDGHILPYADNSFDAAFTICVMHHVPPAQWEAFLKEIYRVLKPGGLFCVFEHNPLNPITRKIVNECPLDENAVLLRSGHLRKLINGVGFIQSSCKFILFTPFDHPVFHHFDRLMSWLPLGAQYYATGTKPI